MIATAGVTVITAGVAVRARVEEQEEQGPTY